MYDLNLEWGTDLSVGSGGDLGLVNGSTQAKQRVIRRLLTNPGDYIWNPEYGGQLARFVGSTAERSEIESVIRNQLSLESAVSATPVPNITVQSLGTVGGYVVADIVYQDSFSGGDVNVSLVLS